MLLDFIKSSIILFCVVMFSARVQGVPGAPERHSAVVPFHFRGKEFTLSHGSVVIAAITSCTNTSNPSVMLGAGVLTLLNIIWRDSVQLLLLAVIWHFKSINDEPSYARTPRKESDRMWFECEAVHKDQPVARQWSGHLLPERERCYGLPLSAGVSCSNDCFHLVDTFI